MERRAFLRAMVGGAALAPATAWPETPAGPARIGVLMSTNPVSASHIVKAFSEGLRERGLVEGQSIILEYRWAEGKPGRLSELAADLVRQQVRLIVASSQAPALAAHRATKTIPIVMVNTSDPVEVGLVASLGRPGGNVTGLSQQLTPEIRAKQLQLLKEALPKISRVAVLRSPATTVGLQEYESAGQTLGLRIQFAEIRSADDLPRAFTALVRERVEALLAPGDILLFTERARVVALAREHRLPGIYSLREFTEAGGLMSYSARISGQFRRAAVYVDKILRGASPATLPVESPTQYELTINLKTARTLGITIPEALLVRADEIIQ
ncbi:MAG TPA: ABC transporter substrate-binding protein [Methylomirabilota bacterium]|jgi:putative ABC transport system substrate-binding protein